MRQMWDERKVVITNSAWVDEGRKKQEKGIGD